MTRSARSCSRLRRPRALGALAALALPLAVAPAVARAEAGAEAGAEDRGPARDAGSGPAHAEGRAEGRERPEAGEAADARPAKQDLLYALGAILGGKIAGYGFTPVERSRVEKGFADAAAGRKLRLADPDLEEWGAKVDAMLAQRSNPQVAAAKEKGRLFADAAAREPGATRLPSGVVIRSLREGAGKAPLATSRVKVSYAGKLLDGTQFDSSAAHGGTAEFPLNGVIPCWTEGVQRMKQGGKARLVCPSSAAYGDQGRPPSVPGGATLVFEIDLLGVE